MHSWQKCWQRLCRSWSDLKLLLLQSREIPGSAFLIFSCKMRSDRLYSQQKLRGLSRAVCIQKGKLMTEQFKAPATPAERVRDKLLGALVGLARATTSEPKTDDTDEVLNAGLRLLAQPDVPEEKLQRMLSIVHTEKHRVAPNCAACAMPCGNTNDYNLARLWNAPQDVRALKLRMLAAAIRLAQQRPAGDKQTAVYRVLFTLAEDWDEALLLPAAQQAEELCGR